MSRTAKWKTEKAKIKAVFRLQFHATHIPQAGWDKLFVSFIPSDSGKTTAKTTKANVRNGTCKWADPIYETTRLIHDRKTKRYDEKLYKLVVAMGTSRSSLLGEAIINLADFADALKPYVVALPLHGTDWGTILHVTIQLLTSKTGFREFEQQRELSEKGFHTNADQYAYDESTSRRIPPFEETVSDQMDKKEEAGLAEDSGGSVVGMDNSSNASKTLYAERQELLRTHELENLKSTTSGNLGAHSPDNSFQTVKGGSFDHQLHSWGEDNVVRNDLYNVNEENRRLRGSLKMEESSISMLKMEVISLQSHANEIGVETKKISEKIAAEVASGEELAKEVSLLASEFSKFKYDLQQLKSFKLIPQISVGGTLSAHNDKWLEGLRVVENKLREIQNKASLGFHEKDLGFLHPEFEALLDVLHDLKQVTGQHLNGLTTIPSEKPESIEIREIAFHKSGHFVSGVGFQSVPNSLSVHGMVSPEIHPTDALKEKIIELMRELDESRSEQESFARKMDQTECYYEALVQELEENRKKMLGELDNLKNEHSTCFHTISSAKTQMERVHQEMNGQILRFTKDRQEFESLNKELKRRAVTSEAALKRARLNSSITVNRLQKDLELLSIQVLSMFETNESLIVQTYAEASEQCLQGHLGMTQNHKQDGEEPDASKMLRSQNQNVVVKEKPVGEDELSRDSKQFVLLREELCRKGEEEMSEMQLINLYLDLFSITLQNTLLEAVTDNAHMKGTNFELLQQLQLSNKSEALLMQRLQNVMDDVHSLNEYKSNCIAWCNDMVLQNQQNESKLGSMSKENSFLRQKISEFETLVEESKNYEVKLQVYAVEKAELEDLLNQQSLENARLQNEISCLEEELEIVKNKVSELTYANENFQKILRIMQEKLGNLVASYDQNLNGHSSFSKSLAQDWGIEDFIGVLPDLQELQQRSSEKILQLMEERKALEEERDSALKSVRTQKSEILVIEHKYEHDLQDMLNEVNKSTALVQKLQSELDAFANKLNVRCEATENFMLQDTELFSNLADLEVVLEELTSKNKDLAGEISALGTIAEELERSKSTIAECKQEKLALTTTLKDKTEESVKLAMDLNNLKETLKYVQDELHLERENRDILEGLVADLSQKMNESHDQLLQFDRQKSELALFRQLASNLELENSEVCQLLVQCEERLQIMGQETSLVTFLESQISEMLELFLAADVESIFTRLQYEAQFSELVQKLQYSDKKFKEFTKQHPDLESRLNHCLVNEEQHITENARLLMKLESLRSDFGASITENKVLMDSNPAIIAEAVEYENQAAALEVIWNNRSQHVFEVEQVKRILASFDAEINDLVVAKVELETKGIIVEEKLKEQCIQLTMLEEHGNELVVLQNQCNELTRKLSEQILRTEEFKNLSLHFKELKDKADAECLLVCESRESELPSVPVQQESLRIAFIREQYESKLQELRHQLSISKKHGEGMLLKLQDAVDEIEKRKKSEAFHLKKNEELATNILELEAELQLIVSDKREKIKAYDRLRDEMECSSLTLEFCTEEKHILETCLQECNDEKSKLALELELMKELLQGSPEQIKFRKEGYDGSQEVEFTPRKLVTGEGYIENPDTATSSPGSISRVMVSGTGLTERQCKCTEQVNTINREDVAECSTVIQEQVHPNALMSQQPLQSTIEFTIASEIPADQRNLVHPDAYRLCIFNDHFKGQNFKSGMENLHEELKMMIHDNSPFPENYDFDPSCQGLQKEFMQLNKANGELGTLFPSFQEFPNSGNAVERVLAFELKLAEALQSEQKSSSFIKQHCGEEAIFQCFRDINELMKDMLELKRRNAATEIELKEMHDCYSQLSLQFAELEGERQKLMMTLKNVRAFKNTLI